MTSTPLTPPMPDSAAVAKPRPLPITVPARPESLWPDAQPARSRLLMRLLTVAVLVATSGYLVWRVAATLGPQSLLLGIPLLMLETWSLIAFALKALVVWDVDGASRPVPVEQTSLDVAVLIPTRDEPHSQLLPTLAAATRMRLATQVIVLDDGHREWLAGMCDELGIEYRTRTVVAGGRGAQLNAVLSTLDSDLVVVLDPDQVADRDLIGRTLGHFDDPTVALVQTAHDAYNKESFEHVRQGRRTFAEGTLFERVLGAGRNRWNSAFWNGGAAILRMSALQAADGVSTGSGNQEIETSIRLHAAGWRTVQHNEVLSRGRAALDAADYLSRRSDDASDALLALRRARLMTLPGLSAPQRLSYLNALGGSLDGWRTLGYLVLAPLALLLAATPATGPVTAFAVLFVALFALRQLAMRALGRGEAPRAQASTFAVLRMAGTLGATTSLLTGRPAVRRADPDRSARRVPPLLWVLAALNIAAAIWAFGVVAGRVPVDYPATIVAVGAGIWTAANLVILARAIARIRSTQFGGDRRKAMRIEVEGHVYLDGERVHVLDLSLTGVRLLSYGEVPEVGTYSTMMFTDPNRRAAVVTGTVVGIEQRPHGHEVRIALEDDQTYVLGAILAEALIRRA